MNILALDTSGPNCSVAVINDAKVIANFNLNVGTTHSQILLPLIDELSKYSNLSTFQKEIDSLNEQIAAEEEYSKELDETAKKYTSDEYVEQYARGLGLVKPNEKIFRNYNDKK